MSQPWFCPDVMPNPDVSGIGIRVSLYITGFLLALIPRVPRTQPLISSLLNNSRLYTLSLLLTAIIQIAQGQLTLYHAYLVLYMLLYFGAPLLPEPSDYDKKSVQRILYLLIYLLPLVAFTFCVILNKSTFSSRPNCNDMIISGIFPFVSMAVLPIWFIVMASTMIWRVPSRDCPTLCPAIKIWYEVGKVACHYSILPWFRVASRLAIVLLGVLVIELTIWQNRYVIPPGENVWSFGQILSLVLLLGFFNDAINWYNDRGEVSPPLTWLPRRKQLHPTLSALLPVLVHREAQRWSKAHMISPPPSQLPHPDPPHPSTPMRTQSVQDLHPVPLRRNDAPVASSQINLTLPPPPPLNPAYRIRLPQPLRRVELRRSLRFLIFTTFGAVNGSTSDPSRDSDQAGDRSMDLELGLVHESLAVNSHQHSSTLNRLMNIQ
ncbi:hypothetical protein BD410DRAFT_902950 [Rickenella mellea]|uniref:Uncharacterized protein n=1 Tax=Rickenella mellea TaxID=50990 RepID=A0A4Y7PGW2_9AGAM|nr:hypothetical protein BD410DRAFT_902950 [Rickenella mellea]